MTDATIDYNAEALNARWTAVVNDEIGGWAVTTNGAGPLNGGRMAADLVMTRELAEHIADLHNQWVARQNRGVPVDDAILSRSEIASRLGYPGTGVPQATGFITTVDASPPAMWWTLWVPVGLAAIFGLLMLWLAVT